MKKEEHEKEEEDEKEKDEEKLSVSGSVKCHNRYQAQISVIFVLHVIPRAV